MSRPLLLLLSLFFALPAAAQHPDDEYYPYAVPEGRVHMVESDTTLFYRAVQRPQDLYGALADFHLPRVSVRRRGQPYSRGRMLYEGIGVDYRAASALRFMGAGETAVAGLAALPEAAGLTGGLRGFAAGDDTPLQPYRLSVRLAGRDYLAGARFSVRRDMAAGWRLAAGADLRTGRDLRVEGVFTHALTAALRAERRWGDRRLSATLLLPLSMRGMRLSSVGEAFRLTGDPLYNPAWGFQNGRVRNSRVRRDAVPVVVAAWRMPLSSGTSLAATLGLEAGRRGYSALGWYDAPTPMPDNYRYLPSYTGDRATEEAWRRADARYTQVDWDGMIARNRMAGGEAVHALEERVERVADLHAALRFTSRIGQRLVLRYGVSAIRSSSRSFKRMRDLLGARFLTDVDHFLIDDDTYGNRLQNDLRHPARRIRQGDRFGYDYSFVRRDAVLRLRGEWRSDRLRLDFDASIGSASVRRRGHYEKELFPGAGSYGSSRLLCFTPYTFKALAGWSFSPRSYLACSALAAAVAPEAEELFYQPLYNNRTVETPHPERLYGIEADWRFTGPVLTLHVSLFATGAFDGVQTRRYYDDMAGLYCDVAATGIATLSCGVEAAAELRPALQWQLSLAASAGSYRYIRDPRITVLSDADNTAVDLRAVSHMGGCRVGGAPQLTACAEAAWFGGRGWGVRMSAGYAGVRSVEPSLVRRTARIARQGGVTERMFDAFMRQERLPDAFTLDAAVFRSFRFGRSTLTASLMLYNLTGHRTVASGYEALRIRRIRAGAQTLWQPQATRYTYVYPRSFYLTVSYRF